VTGKICGARAKRAAARVVSCEDCNHSPDISFRRKPSALPARVLDPQWRKVGGWEKRRRSLRFEEGMKNGNKIRFREKGNMSPGFLPGDIVVILKTKKHAVFQRKNADLLMRKHLSLHEALCGFEFIIKHLDGREILIKSKPGQMVANNSLKMLEGEGFPHRGDKFEKGSLFVNFLVDFPGNGKLTAAQQRNIRNILTGSPVKTLCPRTEDSEITTLRPGRKEDVGKTKYAFKDDGVYDESDSDDDDGQRGQRCRVQ